MARVMKLRVGLGLTEVRRRFFRRDIDAGVLSRADDLQPVAKESDKVFRKVRSHPR
jgi:hypothetical protein